MPTLETGFFLLILGFGFVFTFFAFKGVGNVKGILHITALALFAVLAAYTGAGYTIATTTQGGNELIYNGTGSLIQNITKSPTEQILIPGGENSYWFSAVFTGLAMLNLVLFVKDVWSAS